MSHYNYKNSNLHGCVASKRLIQELSLLHRLLHNLYSYNMSQPHTSNIMCRCLGEHCFQFAIFTASKIAGANSVIFYWRRVLKSTLLWPGIHRPAVYIDIFHAELCASQRINFWIRLLQRILYGRIHLILCTRTHGWAQSQRSDRW